MNHPSAFSLLPVPASADLVRQAAAASLTSGDNHLSLLFDAAAHPDGLAVAERYVRRLDAEMFNLLDGLPEGDAPEVGTYLLRIDPGQAQQVFDYWATSDIQPAAVWLLSQWEASKLASHLRQFVLVQHRANKSGLLRIADPYVWQVLCHKLENSVGQGME